MPVNPLSAPLAPPLSSAPPPAAARETGGGAFARVVGDVLGGAVNQQVQADAAVRDLALGRTDHLHNVLLEVAKADIAFRMVLEMRNRLTEAYQEVMKMQF
jgi:flagellar hook-basal body complex protein FliE